MPGIGTLVNCLAVIFGTAVGCGIKEGISQRFSDIIMSTVGLSVLFIGFGGAMSGLLTFENGVIGTQYTMLMVLSMVLGGVLGEWIDIERQLQLFGEWFKSVFPKKLAGNTFVEGFVTSSMLFCIGAMAIVGALEDGLNGNYSILFAKAVIDGITAVIFSASLGIGVGVSAISVFIYQGGITLLAQFVKPYLTPLLIGQMSCIGSILIFAIGVNVLFGKKIKVGNLLPAVIMPAFFMGLKIIFPWLPL